MDSPHVSDIPGCTVDTGLIRLMAAAGAIQAATTEDEAIQMIAAAIYDAGWDAATVYLYSDKWQVTHEAFVGFSAHQISELHAARPTPDERAALFGREFEPFLNGRTYIVPSDAVQQMAREGRHVPGRVGLDGPTCWHGRDIVYVPMLRRDGTVMGSISLHGPRAASAAGERTFEVLEFFAELTARTIENLRLVWTHEQAEAALRRREAIERRLRCELDHRVRNNLAALLTLIRVTRHQMDDVGHFADAIAGRVQLMGIIHTLVSNSHRVPLSLRHLIGTLTSGKPVAVDAGPDAIVSPRQAAAMAMVIHEIITERIDRDDAGCPHLTWHSVPSETAQQCIRLEWSDAASDDREDERAISVWSFVDGMVRCDLQGSIVRASDTDGFVCHVVVHLDPVEASSLQSAA